MTAPKNLLATTYRHFATDSLYRNAIFLMANTAVLSLGGLLFWIIASHYYSTSNVGLSTALLSSVTIISFLSYLGFDTALIRFLPRSASPNRKINTAFSLVGILSLLLAVIYTILLPYISPRLLFITSSILTTTLFVVFAFISSLNGITNIPFIAFRKAHFILTINVAFTVLRIGVLVVVPSLGILGIILSQALATIVALLLTFYYLARYAGTSTDRPYTFPT